MRLWRSNAGFSMLEVSVALVVLAGAAVLLLPSREASPSYVQERELLETVDRQLWYFMARHSRLPCPASTPGGAEDCANQGKGYVPFRTLGMDGSPGLAETPLLYSVYRRGSASTDGAGALYQDADLAVTRNRYEPLMADGTALVFSQAGAGDLCASLDVARGQGLSTSHTHIRNEAGQRRNVAFAIASPGADQDDQGAVGGFSSRFDGINASTASGFNSDNTPVGGDYDDRVISRDFDALYSSLQCPELIESMNLIANGRQSEIEVSSSLDDNRTSAIRGSVINSIGFINNGVDLVQAGFAVGNATVQLSAAVSALSAAISSCFVLVGCALIPGYVAAVAAASAGVASGTVAVAATAASTSTQVAGTAMYIYAAATLGTSGPGFEDVDVSENIETLESDLDDARDERQRIQADLTEAEQDLNSQQQQVSQQRDSIGDYARQTQDPSASGEPAVITRIAEVEDALQREQQLQDELNTANTAWQEAADTCEAISGDAPDMPDGDDAVDLPDDIDYPDLDYDGDPSESEACITAADTRDDRDQADQAYSAHQTTLASAVVQALAAAEDHQVHDADGAVVGDCSDVAACTMPHDWYHEVTVDGETQPAGLYGDLRELAAFRRERDTLREQLDDQDTLITELGNSLESMRCIDRGLRYDQDADACVDPEELGDAAGLSPAAGAESILRTVEDRALVNP